MEKQFAPGLDVKLPGEKAPSFVKMRLGFKVADFAAFLSEHENNNGWVNVDVLESKDGTKLYGVLNDYKPQKPNMGDAPRGLPQAEVDESSIPF